MRLIVDTNRIIAALVRDSTCRELLFHPLLELVTVNVALKEIEKYRSLILRKARLDGRSFDLLLTTLLRRVRVLPDVLIEEHLPAARKIMGPIDVTDSPFIAAAMAIENNGIWSDDTHFQRQSTIRVWTTRQLVLLLR